ncbi:biosynthetic-type acetolactate synthase large subunit [uncultured Ruthenibacterium sp.]|uniref:biosynthetic-type acetolactate synthase large subunit n=1 Tax=uncultured Ruthenibacterium sp. TaxID=1905347 RepID=UPI00349EBC09
MLMTGADIFAEVLVEQGVDTLFGYPGGAVLNLYDALYNYRDKIHHVMTAHEQGAAHAADGYARATGKTGVVLATSGPGATNLVTGIATAYMDSIPMVAITGNVGTSLIGKDSFQEVYITGITMPITKHNFVVRKVEELADILRDAFRIAQTGRKGPVLVDIPKDVTSAKAEFYPQKPQVPVYNTSIEKEALEHAAEMINSSQRPIIYFGGGVSASQAGEELLALAQKAEIPAAYTIMAAGVLSYGDPLNLGLLGMHGNRTTNWAVNEADLVLAIGTRFSDRVALNPGQFAKKAKILQIDIDPSEINKNVDVNYSLIGDVKQVLQALLPLVKSAKHPDWMAIVQSWQAQDYHPKNSDTRIMPHQLIGKICELAGPDAVYVTDVGQHQMWAAQYIRHVRPRSFLTSGGLGTMGFGYGAAIGAKLAVGDRPVIHLTGDGSFHMNLNEACTAVSYELPIITVIFNNTVLGMVRQWQTAFYDKRYSSTDPHRKTNYVKLAEGFGAKGYHCESVEEFSAAFEQALKSKGPVWIECVIDKDEKVLPMIPAGGTIEDMIMD